tara:strand:- start:61 stop:573 length:513 start_codon:yes stop_codon:yes gene_type:complete
MKGYIYKLYCLDDNIKECYIGSCWDIKVRMGKHNSTCNNINRPEYNYKVYTFIRTNGGWCNWDYEYYEVEVIDKTDLRMKEQDRMDIEVNILLNEVRAYTDRAEYEKQNYIDNKASIRLNQKQYRIDNKKSINLKQNQKYECDCGGRYRHSNKKRHLRTYKHQAYLILQI